jgi:hypothetical protein
MKEQNKMKQCYPDLKFASRKSIIVLATAFLPLVLQSIASPTYILLFVYAQQQQQSASGWGESILPGNVPTLFSFNATKDKNGKVSGVFECFAVMLDGKTMYVNGTVTDLTYNETSVIISGPAMVTGFGAGVGTYKAIATPLEGSESGDASNGTLILTTDVNGDGIQGNMPDGSEGPFNENIVRGSIETIQ